MNIVEEYFWKANMAFQINRLNDSCEFICQAIRQLHQLQLTVEQMELVWLVISKTIINRRKSIERLVHYHQSMPMETDELFDRLTQSYVNQLEQDQANFCNKLIHCFEERNDTNLKHLQSDLYLQLSYVSRPYQSQIYYNKHRKLLNDHEHM